MVIKGGLTVDGVTELPDVIGGTNLNTSTGISTFNNVSIGGSLGITLSTNNYLVVDGGRIQANEIGIGTGPGDSMPEGFDFKVSGKSELSFVGIGTTVAATDLPSGSGDPSTIQSDALFTCDAVIGLDRSEIYIGNESSLKTSATCSVSIGTTAPLSVLDFKNAGIVGTSNTIGRFMIPPTVTTDEKVGLGTTAGGIVYDSTLNKLQCFDGTTWNNLF